jgi:hypothetical protein
MVNSTSKTRKIMVTLLLSLFILAAFIISGFTIAGIEQQNPAKLLPLGQEQVNVITNGGFELPFEDREGVAPFWEPYSNGQAQFGWYEETWPEAVYEGERAQLMEIFLVEPNVQSRVIAIHQTVDVRPNSIYDLEFFAMMRSQVQPGDRNRGEFEMHWGIDYSGEANYDNVEEWVFIPLEEQFRLGSTGEYPDDVPLFYEVVTGTVETEDSSRITLFIRGLKKFSTGAEVNFDVDEVSLIGPPPGPVVIITPVPTVTVPSTPQPAIPDTGAVVPQNFSRGALIFGGLVLVVLGGAAVAGLLMKRQQL